MGEILNIHILVIKKPLFVKSGYDFVTLFGSLESAFDFLRCGVFCVLYHFFRGIQGLVQSQTREYEDKEE